MHLAYFEIIKTKKLTKRKIKKEIKTNKKRKFEIYYSVIKKEKDCK